MFTTFKEQIEKILTNTEKEALKTKNKADAPVFAQITMFKIMVGAITKFVENEASENETFNEALSYEWKSAERLLKFIWGKAKELALPGNFAGASGSACCIPDDVVWD